MGTPLFRPDMSCALCGRCCCLRMLSYDDLTPPPESIYGVTVLDDPPEPLFIDRIPNEPVKRLAFNVPPGFQRDIFPCELPDICLELKLDEPLFFLPETSYN